MYAQIRSTLAVMSLSFGLFAMGCGGAESSSDGSTSDPNESTANPSVTETATGRSATAAAIAGSTPEFSDNAPVLKDVYPQLTDGALRHARLVDLPAGVLLQAKGVSVTKADLDKELQQMPESMRENAFFILEQFATGELLTQLARQSVKNAESLQEEALFQQYFENLTSAVSVSDAEIKAFYDDNRGLVGDAALDQARDRIRQHLLQQKQQQLVEEHVTEIGKAMTIAVSADWIKEQAPRVLDNPVDKARGNGKPTFVNFGAQGCRPCDMMEPIREKLAEEYEGQLNVVFVHVRNQQMLASRYGVRGIPHLVFFDGDGKQVHTHTGFMPEKQIREWLHKIGVQDT